MAESRHDGHVHRRITGKLVIATHNPGKLAEMRELLAPHGIEAVSAGELGLGEPDETGNTFHRQCPDQGDRRGTGRQLPAFADDSGLVVEALDGAPGIYSARWAGPNKDFTAAMTRIERLLQERGAKMPAQRRRISFPHYAWRGPTIILRKSRRAPTAHWSGRRAAAPASVTIRCSCPMDTGAPTAK